MIGQNIENEMLTARHMKQVANQSNSTTKSSGVTASKLAAMYAIAGVLSAENDRNFGELGKTFTEIAQQEKTSSVKPKGSKEWVFSSTGAYICYDDSEERMLKSDVEFKCFARNYKNAKRKFDNYINNRIDKDDTI